jgi:hypothetical protein
VYRKESSTSESADQSSFVRYVVSPGGKNEVAIQDSKSDTQPKGGCFLKNKVLKPSFSMQITL